jgi:hypothetical protein
MTKHYIDIVKKWAVILAYDVAVTDLDELASWLDALGCGRKDIEKACKIALGVNNGFTYTNSDLRMSLVVISDASDKSQWWDTLVHEIDHVQSAICDYYDVPLGGEAAAWTQGYIMRKIINMLCD